MRISHMDRFPRVVLLPHYGEFGWRVLHHLRYIHAHPALSKIVCCQKGEECLYPTANGFYTDWTNPIADACRMNDGAINGNAAFQETDRELKAILSKRYPRHGVIRPFYDCFRRTANAIKFKPAVPRALNAVDIALGCRMRDLNTAADWEHFPFLISSLQARGLRVGICGIKERTVMGLGADVYAWEHPEGATAGTIDLLSHCKLFVGTDSGISHLAASMDVPMFVFRKYAAVGNYDLTEVMRRANAIYFRRLPDDSWDRPGDVLEAVIGCLAELSLRSIVDE